MGISFNELIFSFRTMRSPYLAFFTPFRGFSDCGSCGIPVKAVIMMTEKSGVCPECYGIGGKLNAYKPQERREERQVRISNNEDRNQGWQAPETVGSDCVFGLRAEKKE